MNKKFFRLSNEAPFNNMWIVHIFFSDVQPVFFLMAERGGLLYVVSLCDEREELRWIVSPVRRSNIRRMLMDQITPRELFQMSQKLGDSFIIIKKNKNIDIIRVPFDNIDELDLPTAGIYFETEVNEIFAYCKSMNSFDNEKVKFSVKGKHLRWMKKRRNKFYGRMKRNACSDA